MYSQPPAILRLAAAPTCIPINRSRFASSRPALCMPILHQHSVRCAQAALRVHPIAAVTICQRPFLQVGVGGGQTDVGAQVGGVLVFVLGSRGSNRLVTSVPCRQCKHLWARSQRLLGGASDCFKSVRLFSRSHFKLRHTQLRIFPF